MTILTIWRRQWHPTPVLLPGNSHGRRSLVGCSPWGREESDMTERLHFHFSVSCIGEGNGNPLQWSSLENPKDGGAWWAVIYGVAQSWTRLKWLSSLAAYIQEIVLTELLSLCCACIQSCLILCDPMHCQAPLSMEFSRQEYWSGVPFPSPGDLPNSGIEPTSPAIPALAGGIFTTVLSEKLFKIWLNTFHGFTCLILSMSLSGGWYYYHLILKMKNLKHRVVKFSFFPKSQN